MPEGQINKASYIHDLLHGISYILIKIGIVNISIVKQSRFFFVELHRPVAKDSHWISLEFS